MNTKQHRWNCYSSDDRRLVRRRYDWAPNMPVIPDNEFPATVLLSVMDAASVANEDIANVLYAVVSE